MTFYVQTLAVPARRDLDASIVQRGEELFEGAGCSGCHIPTLRTGILPDVPAVSNQTIHPYTDLLLHDMDRGWRTIVPIFLQTVPNGGPRRYGVSGYSRPSTVIRTSFTMAGARGILEAILWHGGEADPLT